MASLLFSALAVLPVLVPAQEPRLEGTELEAVIDELAQRIGETYVFPDQAERMGVFLHEQLWNGAYEGLNLDALSQALTRDLRSINQDRHLNVRPLPSGEDRRPDPELVRVQREEAQRAGNHGFRKLEILEGNVGYLDLRGFAPIEIARETAVGAMAFFANVDALVIDLRQNGGGEPSMIQLLCTYFFEERTLLNTFEWRGQEGREEYWTLDETPGKKMVDVPLFLLTSHGTFSAAEEFSYDLQNLKRATLVGETTGGGAHPGDTHPVGGKLLVFIPNGRAINPITGTNWEGTGVKPEVETQASEALDRALPLARAAAADRRARRSR